MIVTETTRSSFRIPNLYREKKTLNIFIHTHTYIYIYIYIKGAKNVQYSMHSDKEGYEFRHCTTQQHKEKLICVEME